MLCDRSRDDLICIDIACAGIICCSTQSECLGVKVTKKERYFDFLPRFH